MSYSVSLDEIDGCLIVTDSKHTVKVERFATDGIREVYGRTVELLDRENQRLYNNNVNLRKQIAQLKKDSAQHMIAEKELDVLTSRLGIYLTKAQLHMMCEALAVRNGQLRRLATDMHADLTRIIAYPQYAVRHKDELCEYDDRMRALGMEVPDE